MALKGTDSISIRGWIADLSYSEVHSFIWAFGLCSGGAVMLPVMPTIGQAGFAAAFAILLLAFTGKKYDITVPPYLVEQVREEGHYFISGMIIGSFVGYVAQLIAI